MRSDLERIERARAEGEPPDVEYVPAVHPGIVLRMALAGETPDRIAAAMGIGLKTYEGWLLAYPEMQAARLMAEQADQAVVSSLFQIAVGWRDPNTGKVRPPDAKALVFWLKARCGWSDQVAAKPPPLDISDMTQEQLRKRAEDLLRAIERSRQIAPPEEEGAGEGEDAVGF